MDIEHELIDYIGTEIAYDRPTRLELGDTLLDGVLDSTDILRLVVFVEERYGIEIGDDDLVPENFETIASVAALVRARRGG